MNKSTISFRFRICAPCYEDLPLNETARLKSCPVDNELVREVFSDRSALLQIIKIPVYCLFKEQGCTWEGMIAHFLSHIQHDCKFAANWKLCQFSVIGCTTKGSKTEINTHYEADFGHHLFILGTKLNRLSNGLDRERSLLMTISIAGNSVGRKLEENYDSMIALKASITGIDGRMGEISTNIQSVRQDERKQNDQFIEIENASKSSNVLLKTKEVQVTYDKLTGKIDVEERRLEETGLPRSQADSYSQGMSKSNTELKMKRLEKERKTVREHLAEIDLKIRLFQATTTDGIYMWKIDNYPRRMREAREGKILELYSPPLYSHFFGYRICCKIYLNGNKNEPSGHGTHVAFYMVVMKGEFDLLLPFPFPRIFKATLLAHNPIKNVEKVIEPKNTVPFQMPKEEMNPMVGHAKFVSHAELAGSDYLWDDALFFSINFTETASNLSSSTQQFPTKFVS